MFEQPETGWPVLHNYHDVFKSFPPGGFSRVNRGTGMGYTVFILPFMEQQALHDQFNFEHNHYTGVNYPRGLDLVSGYHCPSCRVKLSGYANDKVGNDYMYTTHYYGVMGPKGINPTIAGGQTSYPHDGVDTHGGYASGGVLYKDSKTRIADIIDGTSNTVMVGEISWDGANVYRTWHRGCDGTACASAKNILNGLNTTPYISTAPANFNEVSFGSQHPGGAQFAVSDGSVRFLSETVDLALYKAAADCAGKESQTAIE